MSYSRRKLLKSLATGSGALIAGKSLPETWSRPVVDAVMLPAHAQTSSPVFSSNSVMTAFKEPQTGGNSLLATITSSFTPDAQAGELPIGDDAVGCAMVNGSMLEFEILYTGKGSFRLSGALPLNMQVAEVSEEECGGDFMACMEITSMTTTEVVLTWVDFGSFTIPVAGSCVFVPPLDCEM